MSKIWRHKKTGGLYVIIDDEVNIEKDYTPSVMYMSLIDGEKWVRPREEFHDGRFENLNSIEYIGDGKIVLSHSDAF